MGLDLDTLFFRDALQLRQGWARTLSIITRLLRLMPFSAEVSYTPYMPFFVFVNPSAPYLHARTHSISSLLVCMCARPLLSCYLAEDVLGDLGVRQAMRSIPKNTRL